jgi:type IV pilus assembly protein PilO
MYDHVRQADRVHRLLLGLILGLSLAVFAIPMPAAGADTAPPLQEGTIHDTSDAAPFDVQVEVDSLRSQNEELQRKLTKVRVVSNNLAEFEQEVAGLERELTAALKQLPNRKQFEDLLQDISTAGKKVGVSIKSIQRKPEVPRGFYIEVPFALELEGRYHAVAMFFERVAKLSRIVNIGSLNVTVASTTTRDTIIKVQGTATTFRFVSDDKVAAALSSPYGWRA